MGNNSSSPKSLSNIEDRIQNLEKIDLNNDGMVSKYELLEWKKKYENQFHDIHKKFDEIQKNNEQKNNLIEKLKQENNNLVIENNELKKEIENYIKDDNINSILEKSKEYKKLKDNSVDIKFSDITKLNIDQFVDKMLKDKDMNISYFPDFVERRVYKNSLYLVFNLLDSIFESCHINILGNDLSIDLKKLKNTKNEDSDSELNKDNNDVNINNKNK